MFSSFGFHCLLFFWMAAPLKWAFTILEKNGGCLEGHFFSSLIQVFISPRCLEPVGLTRKSDFFHYFLISAMNFPLLPQFCNEFSITSSFLQWIFDLNKSSTSKRSLLFCNSSNKKRRIKTRDVTNQLFKIGPSWHIKFSL